MGKWFKMSWLIFCFLGFVLLGFATYLIFKFFFNKDGNIFYPFVVMALTFIGLGLMHVSQTSALLSYRYDVALNGVGNYSGVVVSSLMLFLSGIWSMGIIALTLASSLYVLPKAYLMWRRGFKG